MKILALDSSAVSASVAITEDELVIGEFYINTKLTHSQTLMPMIHSLLECTHTKIEEIDLLAVSVGPGSFTGIRIGVSLIKGIATALNKPCVAVSTLDAMSYNLINNDCIICAVMDARCNQVYNALFEVSGNKMKRLVPDRAIIIKDLFDELGNTNKDIFLVGDGASLCYNSVSAISPNIRLSPQNLRYQNAVGVAMAGLREYKKNNVVSAKELMPTYLRLPQAERELKKRLSLLKEL